MKQYFKDLDRYADVLTKEQMRVVCHISKRKAAYLLQAGLIPCINTGKKMGKDYTVVWLDSPL